MYEFGRPKESAWTKRTLGHHQVLS